MSSNDGGDHRTATTPEHDASGLSSAQITPEPIDVENAPTKQLSMRSMNSQASDVATVRKSFTSPSNMVLVAGTVLAACAGIVNAVAWLELGAFVSHMTGSLAKVSIHAQGAHVGRNDPDAVAEVIGLVSSFMFGAVLCGLLITSNVVRFGKELYGVALIGNSSFLFVAMAMAKHPSAKYFAAAACGLQNGMCTSHFGAVCRTTHVTGLVTDAGTALGRLLAVAMRRCTKKVSALDRAETEVETKRLWVYFCLGFGFLVGTKCGAWLAQWIGVYGLAVPATVTGIGGTAYFVRRIFARKRDQQDVGTTMHASEVEHLDRMLDRAKRILHQASQQGQAEASQIFEVARTIEASILRLREGHVGEGGGDPRPAACGSVVRRPGNDDLGVEAGTGRPDLTLIGRDVSPTAAKNHV